ISVVERNCAIHTSSTICQHLARFYPNQVGDPVIYWEIPNNKIPEACRFEQQTSTTGDDCHFNIYGWNRNQTRKTFIALQLKDFTVCSPDGEQPLQKSDVE
ncbi:MAG: hypothetical protein ACREBD_14190, partial [Blastocatellia bacterium]